MDIPPADLAARAHAGFAQMQSEMQTIAQRLGYRCLEVPVRWDNVEGTKVSTWLGLKAFLDLLRVRWNGITGKYK